MVVVRTSKKEVDHQSKKVHSLRQICAGKPVGMTSLKLSSLYTHLKQVIVNL